ncbi:unnamed protein product [Linum tenue]|nr:unnamed protein product [Linum tenue]CAI0554070.1 unnamed protein product [Linum tenue]
MIDMYSKCGGIEAAKSIFERVQRDDVSIWNSMINGLAIHGLARDAIAVFSKMDFEDITPDAITFLGILSACSHSGLVKEGRHYFNLMKSRCSIEPQHEHYGSFVDLLGRAGLLEEAYEERGNRVMVMVEEAWADISLLQYILGNKGRSLP